MITFVLYSGEKPWDGARSLGSLWQLYGAARKNREWEIRGIWERREEGHGERA